MFKQMYATERLVLLCIIRGSVCTQIRTHARKTSNNDTHYVKLDKKRRESSNRNYYIISPRVMIKAIIIIHTRTNVYTLSYFHMHIYFHTRSSKSP